MFAYSINRILLLINIRQQGNAQILAINTFQGVLLKLETELIQNLWKTPKVLMKTEVIEQLASV